MTATAKGDVALRLHDIGEGLAEAVVLRYLVAVGDAVAADQPVVEIETDKVTTELPAPAAGVVRAIAVPEGSTVRVGEVLLWIETEQVDVQQNDRERPDDAARAVDGDFRRDRDHQSTQDRGYVAPNGVKATEQGKVNGTVEAESAAVFLAASDRPRRVLASPYTRRLARSLGIPLDTVTGSGPGGRIEPEDVRRHLEKMQKEVKGVSTVESGEAGRHPHRANPSERPTPPASLPEETLLPFQGRRETIARHMARSALTIPHVTQMEEFELDALLALKARLDTVERPLSLTAYLIKIVSLALRRHPRFNARLDEEAGFIRLIPAHHIGVAVDTPEGLIVPVLHHVEQKSLPEIADALDRLVRKAREGELTYEEISGGTFTISNVGPIGGSTGATPIIRSPEVAVLAFHRARQRPVVDEEDRIVPRTIMPVSLSFDHRVLDGADAIRFTDSLHDFIRRPERLLLEMI